MAISDQIMRLQSAKIDMKSSIENFGIEISNDTKIDEYGSLIKLISMDANASADDILNGKVAYAQGQKIIGKAFSIETSANNATILKGFSAYDQTGQYLIGTAFGNATNANNAMLISGKTAYLNNGIYLKGTLTNRSGTNSEAKTANITNSYITLNIPQNGYYSTLSKIHYPMTNVINGLGTRRVGEVYISFSSQTNNFTLEASEAINGVTGFMFSQVDSGISYTVADSGSSSTNDIILGIDASQWTGPTSNVETVSAYSAGRYTFKIRSQANTVNVSFADGLFSFKVTSAYDDYFAFFGRYKLTYYY